MCIFGHKIWQSYNFTLFIIKIRVELVSEKSLNKFLTENICCFRQKVMIYLIKALYLRCLGIMNSEQRFSFVY